MKKNDWRISFKRLRVWDGELVIPVDYSIYFTTEEKENGNISLVQRGNAERRLRAETIHKFIISILLL